MRSRGFIALAACLAVVGAACTSSSGSGGTTGSVGGPKILRTAFNEDIMNLDPDNEFEVAGLSMLASIYQGLVQYKPGSSQIEGLLAQSWEVSPDYTTFTFHLHSGVMFDDGTPLTAASVKASFERRVQHQDFFTGYFLGGIKSMDTPDPLTLVIHLKSADYSFMDGLCSPWGPKVIGPDALVTHAGSDFSKTWLSQHADGTGPYQLTTYNRGSAYVLKRFPGYWGPKPYFDEIDIKIVPDLGQQNLQLRSGKLDFIQQYPFSQLPSLPSNLKVLSWSTFAMELAIVNTHRIPDRSAREQIAAAIDPHQWVPQAFGNYATPAESNYATATVTPATPWQWPAVSSTPVKVPPITIAYASDDVALQSQVANFMIADLQKVGITATARVMPTDQFDSTAKDPAHGPDISLVHFYPDDAFPGSITYLVYQSGTPLNYLGYSNKQADDLFNQAWGTQDVTQRDQLFLEGAKIGFDDGAFLGLADLKDVVVYRNGLTNLVTYPGLPWSFNYGLVREG
jgi:peptide/nickel transport system substrate-binding protein